MYNKLEEQEYASMVQKYQSEYGGRNLRGFCLEHKVKYSCMLRCLEDGSLDLSNNICERQIRRIAKYRNNSFFVGSPEAGVRFARLMSVFANIRNHKLDPVEYLCAVFRRIKTTSKEKLVGLLAHRWQLDSESVWTSVPSIH